MPAPWRTTDEGEARCKDSNGEAERGGGERKRTEVIAIDDGVSDGKAKKGRSEARQRYAAAESEI